ncbi:MAG: hypothetical protein HYT65_03300 [Candidatus Yanofskybacteria bacterium]|nr:hypothetical protein [Candidatus Yanofskybacteria bacterium]
MSNKDLKKVLLIEPAALKIARGLREKSIDDAIALKGGRSNDARIFHTLWRLGKFEVGVGKPGKEVGRKGDQANSNDMWPYIRENGSFKTESATFRDVFRDLQHTANKSRRALELLGCLFVRSAFMLDHEIKDNKVTYSPPVNILEEIEKDVVSLYGVPLDVFLQYVEMIALNEEVKYYTKGKARGKPYGAGAGRKNNLLTCAHLIAVLLGRAELIDFAYGFSMMRGVSPMTTKKAKIFFPMLGEDGLGEIK